MIVHSNASEVENGSGGDIYTKSMTTAVVQGVVVILVPV